MIRLCMFYNIMQGFLDRQVNISSEFATLQKRGKTAGASTWH
jgi:hypothetical protein